MSQVMPFNEVVEAVGQLTSDEQETLLSLVRLRLIAERRRQIVAEKEASRREFASGQCKPATPDELMREILS